VANIRYRKAKKQQRQPSTVLQVVL